jgi:hypothetical protein
MFFIDHDTERSMQDAQSLYDRAASRTINPSMTLLPDEIQQVPTRIPPMNHQLKDASMQQSTTLVALEESHLDSTKSRNQASEETVKHKNPKDKIGNDSKKSSGKISVATSPLKDVNTFDSNKLLSSVRFQIFHLLAIGINSRSTIQNSSNK